MLQHRHSDPFLPRTFRPYVPSSSQTRGPLATSVCCKRPCDPCGCTKAKPTTQRRFCKWHLGQHSFFPPGGRKSLKFGGGKKRLGKPKSKPTKKSTARAASNHIKPFDIIQGSSTWTAKGNHGDCSVKTVFS